MGKSKADYLAEAQAAGIEADDSWTVDQIKAALEEQEAAAAGDGEGEPIAGAPVEVNTNAGNVTLSEPPKPAARVDVRRPQALAEAQAAARKAVEADAGEGEGPIVGFASKIAAPAPAHVPGEQVDPRRHVPHTVAPPAPTRFDGQDSQGSR